MGNEQGGDGARVDLRASHRSCIAVAAHAMDASARTTGSEAYRHHENARNNIARASRGNFSRTQHGPRVRPPLRRIAPGALAVVVNDTRACIAQAALGSRRRRRKTQNQGMLVDPVVNRMLWT